MNNKNKLPSVVTLLFLTTITVFVWIMFSAYRSFTLKPELKVPESLYAPIDPKLDKSVIDNLRNKIFINE